ncbi:MAG: divalent-cation tolerance protein CutA [Deltaproteobacteria bacterium]|nr:divalent-cation tolerance protein CutA [Deltaproteobacteria bacterium]
MRIILSNCPPDKADEIAGRLVDERHAACVNAIPGVRSTYRWKAKVEHDPETTLLVKTSAAALDRCVARLRELHPYEIPEIVVLTPDVAASFAPYVEWVRGETGAEGMPTGA